MSKNHLCVFVKNPQLGKVKTRLAKSIGNEKALAVYKYLLQHTKSVIEQLSCDVTIWYADAPYNNDIWDEYQKLTQPDSDLGLRMYHALVESKSRNYGSTCIIGSDCPDITSEIINSAFDELKSNDLVIGPASDGGYYLIGMNKAYRTLFENINWSTNTVLSSTIELASKLGLTYHLLTELSDIDTVGDLKRTLPNFYM
jgi:hypothetical protein